ncbi:hypothetical protein MMC24_003129 [Lignoscripta atroalba]|nr:hypothetical protein [Lignoscripta atroalba]
MALFSSNQASTNIAIYAQIPGSSFPRHYVSKSEYPSNETSEHRQPSSNQVTSKYDRMNETQPQPHMHPQHEIAPSSQLQQMDNNYLAPHRANGAGQIYGQISRSGSEADSLLDLYGPQKGMGNSTDNSGRKEDEGEASQDDDDPESSRWIHRDKLALIESQEMQQAGINPRHHGVLSSVSATKLAQSREKYTNGLPTKDRDVGRRSGDKRQRIRSPSPSPSDDEGRNGRTPVIPDPRTPEEIAADPYEEGSPRLTYQQPGLRASSSRIPVSRSSPMPIPQEHLERNTPLPRKRGASGNWSAGEEDSIAYNKTRSRGNSFGSHFLLDDGAPTNLVTTLPRPVSRGTPHASPTKARLPSRGNPTSAARQSSATNRNVSGLQKPRTVSATNRGSPAQRPGTRAGPDGRPVTAVNRPEGDPPWLATMYKPDPRLPPEQQLLPTHAKRLQQEQWEKDGKYGSTFGPDLNPLIIPPQAGQQPTPSNVQESSEKQNERGEEWPFKSTPTGSPKIETSGTEHAGYRTIPKVQSTPPGGALPSPKIQQTMQVQQPLKQEQEKEKGCGCCVVM